MPHGLPDWGLTGPKETTYGLDDLGEHAVRLGSPHTFDRRGDVVWMTDFRDGVGDVVLAFGGVGSGVSLWTGGARQGAYSLRLSVSADPGAYSYVRKYLPLPRASGYGVEFSFDYTVYTGLIVVFLRYQNGVADWRGRLEFRRQLDELWARNAAGGEDLVDDQFFLRAGQFCHHTAKLVVDAHREEYVRIFFNNEEYDWRGNGLERVAPLSDHGLDIGIYHYGDEEHEAYVDIDSIIVTQNEP